jgi:hypothetical protein
MGKSPNRGILATWISDLCGEIIRFQWRTRKLWGEDIKLTSSILIHIIIMPFFRYQDYSKKKISDMSPLVIPYVTAPRKIEKIAIHRNLT